METVNRKFRVLRALSVLALMLGGCTAPVQQPEEPAAGEPAETEAAEQEAEAEAAEHETAQPEAEKTGDIEVLFTSDIHCGLQQGFGVVGLQQIRETLEKKGVETILVDNGDAVQGDALGTLTKGKAIVTIMNDLDYDVVIPGNHDFDFGMDEFFELTEMAEHPYISCNFNKGGELLFDPYIIREAAGKKIAFIGVTTPETLFSSDPKHFQDENGNYIYGFMEGQDGSQFMETIQKNVDEVRSKGADYVVLMAHVGNEESNAPYNFQTIIERTSGIDVILDGHSHDTDQVTMNDKDGNPVIRVASGTKLQGIGYVRISGKDGAIKCGMYSWNNDVSAADLFGIENEVSEPLKKIYDDLEKTTQIVVAKTDVDLVIYDPQKKKDDGSPVRIVRSQETNLADLAADAVLHETGAEIALVNGGGVRSNIKAGDITYGDLMAVMPFSNQLCVSVLTGQQIKDMLEWGAKALPGEDGGFLQVAGMTYEIQADIPSSCVTDTEGLFAGVNGEYRVRNILVGGEPLDLKKTYRVAGNEFMMKSHGDGFAMVGPENIEIDQIKVDNQALIDYIKDGLGGTVGSDYSDPYGEGRITIHGLD